MATDYLDKVLEAICALPLQSLDDEWVKACWDGHFLDVTPLPLTTENLLQEADYHADQLQKVLDTCKQWSNKESNTEGFWTVLLENDVSHKALLAFLAHLIPMDHNVKTCRGKKKEAAFIAATLYLSLAGLQGSRAFKIYNPDLLLRVVDLLKADVKSGGNDKRKKSIPPAGHSQSQPRKRQHAASQQDMQSSADSLEAEEDEEDANDEEELSTTQLNCLRNLHRRLLNELVSFLENFSLRESFLTLDHILRVLGSLVRQDNENFDGKFANLTTIANLGTCELAYKGIYILCQPLHGDITALTTAACKYLLPSALMLLERKKVCASQTIPRNLVLGRNHTLAFIRFLLKMIGKPAFVSIKILLQHMCMQVPDRAEYRSKTAQAVVEILKDFPDEIYAFMLKWIGILSRNEKSNVRTFSLDVICLLLEQTERHLKDVPEEAMVAASHGSLMKQLLARCSDVAASVRARALTGFAQCLQSGGISARTAIVEMITPRPTASSNTPYLVPTPSDHVRTVEQAERTGIESSHADSEISCQINQIDGTPIRQETPAKTEKPTPFCAVNIEASSNNSLPDRDGVISMLHRRARDEKVHVRKSALLALHKLIVFEAMLFKQEDVEILCERCRDKALSVRKQAIASLTEVFWNFQDNIYVQSAWLKGVLPMVWDQETSVQDRSLELIEEIIIINIVPAHRTKEKSHFTAWDLLALIGKNENSDLRRYFRKACRLLEQQKKLKSSLITSAQTHVNTKNNQAAWSLLADIALTKSRVDIKLVVQYWKDNHHSITGDMGGEVWENVAKVITHCASLIPQNDRSELAGDLKTHLLKFYLQPVLIYSFASAVHQLSLAQAHNDVHRCQEWGQDLLVACHQYLSGTVVEEDSNGDKQLDEDLLTCHLYTLGVVAQLCPAITSPRIPILVQSFIATPNLAALDTGSDDVSSASSQVSRGSQATHPSEASRGSQVNPGTQSTQALSQFRGSRMSDRVRAVAFLTLGRLCLQDNTVAKKCVPAMARELELSSSDNIRNNIVIILRDLCVRYTTLVDPYVASMASCLRDPAPLVRRQTIELITGLLQEDYLKWKGTLFFRFICTLLDPHPDIQAFAEFCLGHHLLRRHPTLMSQHLLECIFVFNDYNKHAVFNKYTQTDRERELFSLKGKQNQSNRLKLYHFMLEHMEDEHRFQLTAKISQEVLGAVVDGILPLDEESHDLLQDALDILSSKEIKLNSLRSKPVEDASDEIEMANAVIASAKKTLITQVVKKNVMENVVPVVLSLKHMLEKDRSPLLKDLMSFLRELMKDYKNEIKDILAADQQLACEVEYDLRKFVRQGTETVRQEESDSDTSASGVAHAVASTSAALPVATPARVCANASKTTTPGAANKLLVSTAITMPPATPKTPKDMIQAIREATLRTVENLRRSRQSERSQSSESVSNVENLGCSPSRKSSEGSQAEGLLQTPGRKPLRAFSTPSAALGNLTFAGFNSTLPMVPPSPILGKNLSNAMQDGDEDVNVVFMSSPEVKQPQPKKWKVKVKTQKEAEAETEPAASRSPLLKQSRRGRR
ncbi:condensin-2 complex subunit D3-like [Pomacea canaliculata]|uniref:condensin-2 complex subunit D3-like n=1 Tax=Pomacea canaliculata TaxID=400727 RepID=UPI000D736BE4|nr:condensin-2 complex subunit D3-like [Pomacea canaliculata]